jgi:hypothetical protein
MADKYQVGLILILILASGATYYYHEAGVGIRIDKDRATFYVQEGNRWLVSGIEENKIFAGTSLVKRHAKDVILYNYTENSFLIHIRETPYFNGGTIRETWTINPYDPDVSSFPVIHKVELIGFPQNTIYEYNARRLEYSGETYKLSGETTLNFGKNMKLELDKTYYWGTVYKSGIVKARYRTQTDHDTLYFRLYDPPTYIYTWEDLHNIRNSLSGDYILAANLSSSSTGYDTYASSSANGGEGWVPIGDSTNKFYGTFDGNGHTISDLYINRSSTDNQGLFGYTAIGSELKNVSLVDVSITGYRYVGGLVGYSVGSITKSYATGSVTGSSYYVGGLVGYSSGSIANSYATCSVTGSSYYAGGLVGVSYGSITKSYATGNVTSSGIYVGGLAGYSGSSITNSYATGNVYKGSGTGQYHGGFVGYNYQGSIDKCYSTGYVESTHSNSGGFVGYVTTGGSYSDTNNFWDKETSGKTTTKGNATGKTTAEMMDIDTFSAWDIVLIEDYVDEIWGIDDGNDYPRLGWEYNIIRLFECGYAIEVLISPPEGEVLCVKGPVDPQTCYSNSTTINITAAPLLREMESGSQNITLNFTSPPENKSTYIQLNSEDEAVRGTLRLIGLEDPEYPSNLKVYIGDTLIHSYLGRLIGTGTDTTLDIFSDGASRKYLEYGAAGTQTVYLRLPSDATILVGNLTLEGNPHWSDWQMGAEIAGYGTQYTYWPKDTYINPPTLTTPTYAYDQDLFTKGTISHQCVTGHEITSYYDVDYHYNFSEYEVLDIMFLTKGELYTYCILEGGYAYLSLKYYKQATGDWIIYASDGLGCPVYGVHTTLPVTLTSPVLSVASVFPDTSNIISMVSAEIFILPKNFHTASIYEQSYKLNQYPFNLTIDSGYIGTPDYNNATNIVSSLVVDLNATEMQAFLDDCTPDSEGMCLIPIRVITGSAGAINITSVAVEFTSTQDISYIDIPPSAINNYIAENGSSGNIDVPITITSDSDSSVVVSVNLGYYGSGRGYYYILNQNTSSTAEYSYDVAYSKVDYIIPINNGYIDFRPRTRTDKGVSAYGQTTSRPAITFTTKNYDRNMNLDLSLSEVHDCVTFSVATSFTGSRTNLTDTSPYRLLTNKGYNSTASIWLFADYDCADADAGWNWAQPDLIIQPYCVGCTYS